MSDADARRRILEDLDATLVVEAAAGTGKTTALVGRIVSVLRAGRATLGTILAVTFTDKAAGEMKLRLRAELEAAKLDAALVELETARIGTIHSLCVDLLRERPVEAGVDPLFEIAAGEDAERLLDQAFDGWFQETLADPPEGVRRLLRRRPRGREAFTPRQALRAAAAQLIEHRDFDAPWRRDPFDRRGALEIAFAVLRALPPGHDEDALGKHLARVRDRVDELRRRGHDLDGLEAELAELNRLNSWTWRGSTQVWGDTRDAVLSSVAAARAALAAAVAAAEADLAARLHAELQPVVARYEAVKARAGRLDFLDLLMRARELTRAVPDLGARFTHIFLDEAQDTDPLQLEILLGLGARAQLFVVGDPKQSIYRFRRADVAIYEGFAARLEQAGAARLQLTTSFRAVPSIQSAVNASFPTFAPLAPARPERSAPSVIALPAPRPYGDFGKIVGFRLEASYADAAGAFIAWLVAQGTPARDVCILLKRFSAGGGDATRPYVRALESRGIPHVLVGGRSFHAREEVAALRNAAAAIEHPDDALARFATLRGPFFGLTDDDLLAGQDHGARALLAELHAARNQRPIADTLARLLDATRAHAGLALWPGGEQALANVARVLDQARRFEGAGATSFRAFVRWLEEQPEGADAPTAEEGTEGVRIMTVHRAKGLEFPVVVLGDPTAPAAPQVPSRHIDAERRLWLEPLAGCAPAELLEHADAARAADAAEAVRLVYVAATRARDLLVVPACGDGPIEGWLAPLDAAIQPRAPRRPESATGADTVLERPAELYHVEGVIPGRHVPRAGTHSVVWWDPASLPLDARGDRGLRMQDVLVADGDAEQGKRFHAAWRIVRARVREEAARPTVPTITVTTLVGRGATLPDDSRPHGPRFGALVHRVLAAVPLPAPDETVAALARSHARALGATDGERDAAIATVRGALAHPILVAAAAALEVRREAPVFLRAADGTIIEGVIDLAYRDAEGWVVVEIKTEPGARDQAQLDRYVEAVSAATGAPARGILLVT